MSGAEDMMLVGPAMQRFDELKVGDKVLSYPRVAGLPGAKGRRSDHDCR